MGTERMSTAQTLTLTCFNTRCFGVKNHLCLLIVNFQHINLQPIPHIISTIFYGMYILLHPTPAVASNYDVILSYQFVPPSYFGFHTVCQTNGLLTITQSICSSCCSDITDYTFLCKYIFVCYFWLSSTAC